MNMPRTKLVVISVVLLLYLLSCGEGGVVPQTNEEATKNISNLNDNKENDLVTDSSNGKVDLSKPPADNSFRRKHGKPGTSLAISKTLSLSISDDRLKTFSLNIWYLLLVAALAMILLFLLNFALSRELISCTKCTKCHECGEKTTTRKETVSCYLCDKKVSKVRPKGQK